MTTANCIQTLQIAIHSTAMMITIVLSFLAGLLFLFYSNRKRSQRSSQHSNIPGPKPHWFYGNLDQVSPDKPLVKLINEWTQKYGEVYAFYEGPDQNVVISDPDLVQEAFVRQFSTFTERKRFPLQGDPKKLKEVSMFTAEPKRWKKLRTTVNPAFSESKMRLMFPLMKFSVDQIMVILKEKSSNGDPVDIYEHFKRMTLDVIAECAFGVRLDTQQCPNNQLFNHVKYLFDVQIVNKEWLISFVTMMPELRFLVRPITLLVRALIPSRNRQILILKDMMDVIRQRKSNPEYRRVDILQLLLDAESVDNDSVDETKKAKAKALSIEEIKQQVMLFLLAGYETSSTALAYIVHSLATYPEVQERLQAEVDELYEELGDEAAEASCDRLSSLSYMSNIINETLRFYPIAPTIISRRCSQTIEVGGYTIPAGANIMADVYALHFNPDLWGPINPNVFDPDRFAGNPKRHPSAWIPFGIGPRFCVGQRFALMEIRATLTRIVRYFNIKRCDKTPTKLELKYGPTITPKNELLVKLEVRSHPI